LLSKHPDAPVPLRSNSNPTPFRLTLDEVLEAAKSFPRGSAPGSSGFSADHFRQLLFTRDDSIDKPLGEATVAFANTILSGNCTPSISPYFGSAKLIALMKPDGGVRPIAIGEFFRRLIAKAVMKRVTPFCKVIFEDIQLGVKVPNACEIIIHDLNSLAQRGGFEKKVLLKFDWRNAFNEFSRDILFEEVRVWAPGLVRFVEWIYGDKGNLFYNDKILKSAAGTQQGDPLGPFLFCLVQQRFLRNIGDLFDLDYNKFFMDDGNMVLSLIDVPRLIDYFQAEGKKVGLELNIQKCEIWAPNLSHQISLIQRADPLFILPKVVIHDDWGVKVLGGPVSDSPACFISFFEERMSKVKDLIDTMLQIDDAQSELLLLRNCIALPQLGFHLRVCPANLIQDQCIQYDRYIQEAVSKICGGIVDEVAATQMALPLSTGGLGLMSAYDTAPAAFLASVASASRSSLIQERPEYSVVSTMYISSFPAQHAVLSIVNLSNIPRHQFALKYYDH
jgi:Reverse transcriptase (RNA-dependent DNA polymerase)